MIYLERDISARNNESALKKWEWKDCKIWREKNYFLYLAIIYEKSISILHFFKPSFKYSRSLRMNKLQFYELLLKLLKQYFRCE